MHCHEVRFSGKRVLLELTLIENSIMCGWNDAGSPWKSSPKSCEDFEGRNSRNQRNFDDLERGGKVWCLCSKRFSWTSTDALYRPRGIRWLCHSWLDDLWHRWVNRVPWGLWSSKAFTWDTDGWLRWQVFHLEHQDRESLMREQA